MPPPIDMSGSVRYDKVKMSAKRVISFLCLPILLSSLLFSQSLAEIAQKERERRASLKGKKAVVVTNADLAKLKKKPALEIPAAQMDTESEESIPAEPAAPAATESPNLPMPGGQPAQSAAQASLADLQARWEKAKEYVELLTLKMGALWQEFYSLDGMTSREAIQLAISETFIKLEKAQEDEAKARGELEAFINQQKKESTPSIWIR
jgi:hypothetical protein